MSQLCVQGYPPRGHLGKSTRLFSGNDFNGATMEVTPTVTPGTSGEGFLGAGRDVHCGHQPHQLGVWLELGNIAFLPIPLCPSVCCHSSEPARCPDRLSVEKR